VSPPIQSVNYTDLTLAIKDGIITITMLKNPSNHHLYTPPRPCHPPGLLHGMVYRMINRLCTLVSDEEDTKARVMASVHQLQCHGYQPRDLHPLSQSAIKRAREKARNLPTTEPTDLQTFQFFHIEYHPMNIMARIIQSTWQNSMVNPPNKKPLSVIIGHHGIECGIDHLIITHHTPYTTDPQTQQSAFLLKAKSHRPSYLILPVSRDPEGMVVVGGGVVVVAVVLLLFFLSQDNTPMAWRFKHTSSHPGLLLSPRTVATLTQGHAFTLTYIMQWMALW
jgi:hypothetical protein